MSTSEPPGAPARLQGLLEILRQDPPRPGPDLTRHIVRTARWQRPVRSALAIGGRVGGGLVGGAARVAGITRGSR